MIIIKITKEYSNKRIDIALSEASEFSRSMIQKIIHKGNLLCNEEIVNKPNKTTHEGQIYKITPIQSSFIEIMPEKYDLDILYEDNELIVINKPAHLIVHPGAGNFDNTLINKLAYHCQLSDINGPEKLGTVHRLDKGVSGCIIFAKNNFAHIHLNNQFATRITKKKYVAISHGKINPLEIFAEDFIARSKTDRKKMSVQNTGKLAQMNFKITKIIQKDKNIYSLIECEPITGRMHQIRVQLSHRNLPILNDKTYGKKENSGIQTLLNNRIALHAKSIEFRHPKSNEILKIESKIPEEFSIIMNGKF